MTTRRDNIVCISWATPSYRALAEGIRADCARLGYRYHLYDVDDDYQLLLRAWCNHPYVIREGVRDFGTVLFLDIECRLLRPLPEEWAAPLVSVRSPAQPFWIRYNSGTVLADETCLPWLDTWIRILEDWRIGDLAPGDFVHWPGDLCDEIALAAALAAHAVPVRTVELEYIDRRRPAPLARGLWHNVHTVIQHPTVHHWPKVIDPVEAKKLFWQNYPEDPQSVVPLFDGSGGLETRAGWRFDPVGRKYAPVEFWPGAARPWTDQPVELTSAQR